MKGTEQVSHSCTDLSRWCSEGPCTAGSCGIALCVLQVSFAACSCVHNTHTCGAFQLTVKKKNDGAQHYFLCEACIQFVFNIRNIQLFITAAFNRMLLTGRSVSYQNVCEGVR